MKRPALAAIVCLSAIAGSAAVARAATLDPAHADSVVQSARNEGIGDFCTKPALPLSPRARAMCPMAAQIPECGAFVAACNDKPLDLDSMPRWNLSGPAGFLGALASGVVWILVVGVIGLIVAFVVSAIGRAHKDTSLASPPKPKASVTHDPTTALDTPSDAETLLQRANEHAQRGELDQAALLYLAAALRALDRRGAIRLARHRTNGEYVRACKEGEATPQLRAIVRAVDRVQFGGEAATREGIADVAARAVWIVRAVALASLVLLLGGCSVPSHGPILRNGDPGGDDLFMAVLERQGADVARLGGSLMSLPIPERNATTPLVVVDASRTPLEEDTRVHLARWVSAGGRLLIAGDVKGWPEELHAKAKESSSSRVTFRFPDPDESDEDKRTAEPKERRFAAVIAEPHGLDWDDDAYVLALTDDHVTYAAARAFDSGVVVGLAGDDLLTNAGISVAPNAKAIVALVERYARGRTIRVARPEDGISPPSNPLSALLHAGLGLALAHAAFATALLMLAFGIRQARALRSPPPTRRAWTEHVAATGTLYARAHLAPHALFAYARFADGRLRARMPRTVTDPAIWLATRSRADAAHCAEVWARATSARSADRPRGDELTTLRELHALYAAAMKTE